jgi:hypothetical protein
LPELKPLSTWVFGQEPQRSSGGRLDSFYRAVGNDRYLRAP